MTKGLVGIVSVFCAASLAAADAPLSYEKQIQPLLEQTCYSCHGPAQKMGELDLSSREAMLKGGVHGPSVVPGKPDESRMLLYLTGAAEPAMPLGGKLGDEQVAMLRTWIEQGAVVDADGRAKSLLTSADREITEKDREWWAFQPPVRHDPPGAGNPIDAFLRDRLSKEGIEPAPRTDKRTLIRRAYLDLTGLLPPANEVERFVADDDPAAYEKIVDRLLASPRYGERWGRHWLDVVRYADSSGYEHDFDYANAWRFRDYVIRSFNDDKPYDHFVKEQLAGDELADSGFDALVATGLHRIGARILFREKDNPDYRYTYLDDMIATTGHAFLGLSVECARCHDHKFDPITQRDYYQMMAVFFSHIRYDFPLASEEEVAAYEKQKAAVEAQTKPLEQRVSAIEKPYRALKWAEKLKEFPQEIQDAVNTPEEKRTPGQQLLAEQVLSIGAGGVDSLLTPEDKAEIAGLRKQIREIEKGLPQELPTAMGIRDGDYRSAPDGDGDQVQPGKGDRETYTDAGPWVPTSQADYQPPKAHLLPTADYRNLGPEVDPAVLTVLAKQGDYRPEPPKNGRVSTGRRLALAEWIASEDNPLTARVMVNRIWHHHFGRGLVSTPSNFGKMGQAPSHPELLDWLATEFVRQGWSIKQMHRLIMNSEAYRMASSYGGGKAKDPENFLLWRYPQRRMEAEGIRDMVLDAAGNLSLAAGGAPFFPPIPEKVRESFLKGRWEMTDEGPDVWRRSVYSYAKRGLRYPMFDVFDQPNMNVSCERRTTTTVPTQALTMLNNEFLLEQAQYFAQRVRAEVGTDPAEQVLAAYRIALSREPTRKELDGNLAFMAWQKDYHSRADDPSMKALTDLCDVVLNLNEFVYIQ